jgi:hypothetical protein
MVKHLDRAMENISGHLVRERMKIVAFPDGLKPGKGIGAYSGKFLYLQQKQKIKYYEQRTNST